MTNDTRAAFEAWLNEPVDWDIAGKPIHRRSTLNEVAMMYAEFGFTAAYHASRRAALEEAAKVCDSRFMGDLNREDQEARRCAAAIRKLGDEGVKP